MPYTATNHRIHCYLSYRGFKWEPDIVSNVLPKHVVCQYCYLKLQESNVMHQHRRYCAENSQALKNQETRRCTDNIEGNWVCVLCGETFPKSGTYWSHVFRGCNKKRKAD
ncbi:hypothetical protein L914_01831 [Phytophthora nicotianae]|uniref:C2H2-type domain-containing protein n=1 Tax=Phytophthora nicotianae TaxID=4792 RepID=W2P3S0_PHYNI|nr:hypothetical protein L914_01831 [Phytophthora nicotianae]